MDLKEVIQKLDIIYKTDKEAYFLLKGLLKYLANKQKDIK